MRPQFYRESDSGHNMSEEWGRMSHGGVLEQIVPDYQMQTKIRKFFTDNYFALGDMFKHAAAIGADAGVCTMSFMEFNTFLKESEALKSAPTDTLNKIFVGSHVHDAESKTTNELHQVSERNDRALRKTRRRGDEKTRRREYEPASEAS